MKPERTYCYEDEAFCKDCGGINAKLDLDKEGRCESCTTQPALDAKRTMRTDARNERSTLVSDEEVARYREWLDNPPTAWGDDDVERLLATRKALLDANDAIQSAMRKLGRAWEVETGVRDAEQDLYEAITKARALASRVRSGS